MIYQRVPRALSEPACCGSQKREDSKVSEGAATCLILTLFPRADILGAGCPRVPYSCNPMPESSETRLRADTHVHFHRCVEEGPFLDAAAESLLGDSPQGDLITAVLCLTESYGDDWFGTLARLDEGELVGSTHWRRLKTAEDNSVVVANDRGRRLAVIAGRQIVCRERLEVLALGYTEHPEDGQPIRDVLCEVEQAGALPVLPWGFGKWTGERGEIVRQLLDAPPCEFTVGDNGGRLSMLGEPELLTVARDKGFCILPGTDPFPFQWDSRRVGSFGMEWRGGLKADTPFRSLKSLISGQGTAGERFGRLESLPAFIRNQVAIQLRRVPSKLGR